jgi:hypothetical protein
MRAVRGAAVFALTTGVVWLVSCGSSPTELEVEILATDCGTVTNTTVRAGAPGAVSLTTPAAAKRAGCSSGRIGSIVVEPSGANDAEIEIDVVTGFGKDADLCPPALDGCVHARRIARFVPETLTRITIVMDPLCIGKVCPVRETCRGGACVAADGGDSLPPPTDGGGKPDAPVDSGGPCDQCRAAGGQCRLSDGGDLCLFSCTATAKCGDVTCPPGMACEVSCSGTDACANVTCDSPTCKIACTNSGDGACGTVTCAGASCDVKCDRCTGGVTCSAAKCTVGCDRCGLIDLNPTGAGSTATCEDQNCSVKCLGETCQSASSCVDGSKFTCESASTPKCVRTSCDTG